MSLFVMPKMMTESIFNAEMAVHLHRHLAVALPLLYQKSHQRIALYTQLLTLPRILLILAVISILYTFSLVVYRLYLSPLAAYPGPLLPKVTHWYEFYHNFIRTGMYYDKIREMHHRYGPVVRVSPDEIHVMEPSAYHKLFVAGDVRKTNAYRRFSYGTGFEDMTAISTDHDAHRRLRAPLNKLFSRTSVLHMEPRVLSRVERLCSRLGHYQNTGEVVNLTDALSSLTTDIISSVIFDEPSDYLGDSDFNHEWYETLKTGTRCVPLFKHLPWLVQWIGRPITRYLVSHVTRWTLWDEKARRQVLLIRKRPSDQAKTREDSTVLDHLVHSALVEKELGNGGFARLAQLIQQAGAHNVSHTLGTIIVYLLLEAEEKLEPLRRELAEIWAGRRHDAPPPTWLELEKAPYLSACVAEGLRMAIGGMNRTPRVFPNDDVEVCGWLIPKGTPVSMTTHWMQLDPDIFPKPESFEPSRWLKAGAEELRVMKDYFVPFAKGSRTCVGQNLVYMQLFHTLAHLFRPGSPLLTLHETTVRDIVAVHGLLFPMPPFDSAGVRVTVS